MKTTPSIDRPEIQQSLISLPHWEGSKVIKMATLSRYWIVFAVMLGICFVVGPVLLLIVPWQQNLKGMGRVVAFAPLERQQAIEAPIKGRVVNWWVQEGSIVKKGDPLVEISDIDPNYVSRIQQERNAVEAKLFAYEDKVRSYEQQIVNLESTRDLAVSAARFRVETANQKIQSAQEALNAARSKELAAIAQYDRHKNLLSDGIVSRRSYEVAERDLSVAKADVRSKTASLTAAENDMRAKEADLEKTRNDAQAKIESARASLNSSRGEAQDARASLAKIDVQLSRQQSQLVTAPRDGTVFSLSANLGGEIVKEEDTLCILVPSTKDRAVELWVDGVDAPLIQPGRKVRLMFEGWPAVQFAGWPSVAVGSFGGEVSFIDSTDNGKGKFRMMIVPDPNDEKWPDERFLRQGVRVKGWVLLDQVKLGYEFWRQLNGFPPVISPTEPKSNIARKRIK